MARHTDGSGWLNDGFVSQRLRPVNASSRRSDLDAARGQEGAGLHNPNSMATDQILELASHPFLTLSAQLRGVVSQ